MMRFDRMFHVKHDEVKTGKDLRQFREQFGNLRQKAFAKQLYMKPPALCSLEKSDKPISDKIRNILADKFPEKK